jgi:hypothetical protein
VSATRMRTPRVSPTCERHDHARECDRASPMVQCPHCHGREWFEGAECPWCFRGWVPLGIAHTIPARCDVPPLDETVDEQVCRMPLRRLAPRGRRS